MIRVTVKTDEHGVLREVKATGHSAAFEKGENIVCAAATILLRTAGRLLETSPGIRISGRSELRGELEFSVDVISEEQQDYVKAVGDYLMRGISDLQEEFPGECVLVIQG